MPKYRHVFDFRHYAPFVDSPEFKTLSTEEQAAAARAHARMLPEGILHSVLISIPRNLEIDVKLPPNAIRINDVYEKHALEHIMNCAHRLGDMRIVCATRHPHHNIRHLLPAAHMFDACIVVDDSGVHVNVAKYRHGHAGDWLETIYSVEAARNV